MSKEERDDKNQYNDEKIIWRETAHFSIFLRFITAIWFLNWFLYAFIYFLNVIYFWALILLGLILLFWIGFIKLILIDEFNVKYLLTSKSFIIIKKLPKNLNDRDRNIYAALDKIDQIIIKKKFDGFQFLFKRDSLKSSPNELYVRGIQNYLELISSLMKIIPLKMKIEIIKLKKVVILRRF